MKSNVLYQSTHFHTFRLLKYSYYLIYREEPEIMQTFNIQNDFMPALASLFHVTSALLFEYQHLHRKSFQTTFKNTAAQTTPQTGIHNQYSDVD